MRRRLTPLLLCLIAPACGTIFPRYHTAVRAPPQGMVENGNLHAPPDNLRRLVFVSAELPPSRPDGRTWDDDGDPDLYAVLYRDGEEVYRTPVAPNSLRPEWPNAAVTLRLEPHVHFKIELRDDDGALSELVSETHFAGIPSGVMDGSNILLRLDEGAVVRVRSTPPEPMLGMGVEYEVHETWLRVLAVDPGAPATAAGLLPGDHILAVDGRAIEALGEVGARQAMDRGALRDVSLTVQREARGPFVVDVRLDAVYPAR